MRGAPRWDPNEIQSCSQFEDLVLELISPLGLSPEFVTTLRRCFGIGQDIWQHPNLKIENLSPKPAPLTTTGGALHYCLGWLCTSEYYETCCVWGNQLEFYFELSRLIHILRQQDCFKDCDKKYKTIVVKRPYDSGAKCPKGAYPFIDLLFHTWKQRRNFGYPQFALFLLHHIVATHVDSDRRVVFQNIHLELIGELRNTLSPNDDNSNRKFLEVYFDRQRTPQLSPHKFYRDLNRSLDVVIADHEDLNQRKYAKKLKADLEKMRSRKSESAVYLAHKFSTSIKIKEVEHKKSNPLENTEAALVTSANQVSDASTSPSENQDQKEKETPPSTDKPKKPRKNLTTVQEQPNLEAGLVGTLLTEFDHSTYYHTNPLTPKNTDPLWVYEQLENPGELLDEFEPIVQLIVWLGFQVGADLNGVLSLTVNQNPQENFGIKPSLQSIWRLRPRQQSNLSRFTHQALIGLQREEERPLPNSLIKLLQEKWNWDKHSRILDLAAECNFKEETIELVQSKLQFKSKAWLQHARQLMLLGQGYPEAGAMLLQKNERAKLPAKCAYYGQIRNNLNVAGSPFLFILSAFKNLVGIQFEDWRESMAQAGLIEAWNAWVDSIVFKLILVTGIRPVFDPFSDLKSFTDDFDVAMVEDKDITNKQPNRLVPLPDCLATQLKFQYRTSLKQLSHVLSLSFPKLAAKIENLSNLPSQSGEQPLPFFFHLVEDGVARLGPANCTIKSLEPLQNNVLRHFAANNLETSDRDLIDGLLGHEDNNIAVYGFSSLRTPAKDHKRLRTLASRLLQQLEIDSVTMFSPESKIVDIKAETFPQIYGMQARMLSAQKRRTDLFEKSRLDAQEIIALFQDQDTVDSKKIEAEIQKKVIIAERELETRTEHEIYTSKLLRQLRLARPDIEIQSKLLPRRSPPEFIDAGFCRKLSLQRAAHKHVMDLLESSVKLRSAVNLKFLFVLSLIKLNGITCKEAIQSIINGWYIVGSLKGINYIEIRFSQGSPLLSEPTRRHQLTPLSVHYFQRLCAKKNEDKRGYQSDRLGIDLVNHLKELHLPVKCVDSKLEWLFLLADLESVYQYYALPGSLAAIASGRVRHRSPNLSSLSKLMGEHSMMTEEPISNKDSSKETDLLSSDNEPHTIFNSILESTSQC